MRLNQRVHKSQMKMTSNERRLKMEDDLKIWKLQGLPKKLWQDFDAQFSIIQCSISFQNRLFVPLKNIGQYGCYEYN